MQFSPCCFCPKLLALARHERLSQRQRKLSGFQSQTLQARNTVDRLEADIEDFREIFGNERFHALSKPLLDAGSNHLLQLAAATDAIDVEKWELSEDLYSHLHGLPV